MLDRTNLRDLTETSLPFAPDLVVGDVSFISLTKVLPALRNVSHPDADFVLMVKPQFEVGKERLGKGGVVREPELRVAAVVDVARAADELGLGVVSVCASPLPGPSGNVEYFVWFRRGADPVDPDTVRTVVEEGPR